MKLRRLRPPKDDRAYRQLWRIVDGAVLDTFKHHPEYLTPAGKRAARESINKRVTGAVLGYAVQAAEGRSGLRSAANEADAWVRQPLVGRLLTSLRQWVGARPDVPTHTLHAPGSRP